MMRRDRISPGSRAGMQAWIVSCLFHALFLALVTPSVRHLLHVTPEPFRWTISLVEPFDSPSEGRSTPPRGVDHPLDPLASEGQPFVPPPPSPSGSHKNTPRPQLLAAVHEPASPLAERVAPPISANRHEVPGPPVAFTGLPNRHAPPAPQQPTPPHSEMTRNLEAPADRSKPSRLHAITTEQRIEQTGEPTPPSRSSDQPRPTAPGAAATPSDAETPAASAPLESPMSVAAASTGSVAQDEGESSSLLAARHHAVFHGSSTGAEVPGPNPQDAVHSAPPRPRSDYGWLQQALSRRLEELKRSVRPSIEEPGNLRVLVKAVVSSTGELMEAEIVNSSGHHRIDQDAMTLVQRAFPMSLNQVLDRPQIVMRIPITFSRE